MANKWMKTLSKMEGAVDKEYNPFASENVMRTPSPSINWIFGKGSGLPFGYGALLYGKPKAGKSLLTNLMVGGLHQQDPDAVVVKFNTEMRESGQMEECWGIDTDRYMAYDVNEPQFIFDRIYDEFVPLIEDGMPLKMIIIDSIKGISGVKEANAASITDHLIGDHALTIQRGLKRILPVIRRHRIALVCTEHVRANQAAGPHGPKEKMAGAWAEKHFFEYYIDVKRNNSAEAKQSVTGEKFEKDIKDFKGKKEKTGHKIFVTMNDSSVGVGGRTGQFTLDFERGLINIEEEIFELTKNLGIVERPNNRTYIYDGVNYTSKKEYIEAIKGSDELKEKLLKAIYATNEV